MNRISCKSEEYYQNCINESRFDYFQHFRNIYGILCQLSDSMLDDQNNKDEQDIENLELLQLLLNHPLIIALNIKIRSDRNNNNSIVSQQINPIENLNDFVAISKIFDIFCSDNNKSIFQFASIRIFQALHIFIMYGLYEYDNFDLNNDNKFDADHVKKLHEYIKDVLCKNKLHLCNKNILGRLKFYYYMVVYSIKYRLPKLLFSMLPYQQAKNDRRNGINPNSNSNKVLIALLTKFDDENPIPVKNINFINQNLKQFTKIQPNE